MRRWFAALVFVPGVALAQHELLPPATVVFEDIPEAYPSSDMDVNDLALRYAARCDLDGSGFIVRQVVHFAAVAAGARKVNALEVAVPTGATVRLGLDGGPLDPLTVTGGKVRLFDDFRHAFTGSLGGFVNTEEGAPIRPGRPGVLDIVYATPLVGDCPDVAFALTRADLAAPITLTTTVGDNLQPIAGHFGGDWAVPKELTPIWEAYPHFLTWVSGDCGTIDCEAWEQHPVAANVIARSPASLEIDAPLPEFPTCGAGLACAEALGVCGSCEGAACTDGGGTWDGATCSCAEGTWDEGLQACLGPEAVACLQLGESWVEGTCVCADGTWDGMIWACIADPVDPEAEACGVVGGTWTGATCQCPSGTWDAMIWDCIDDGGGGCVDDCGCPPGTLASGDDCVQAITLTMFDAMEGRTFGLVPSALTVASGASILWRPWSSLGDVEVEILGGSAIGSTIGTTGGSVRPYTAGTPLFTTTETVRFSVGGVTRDVLVTVMPEGPLGGQALAAVSALGGCTADSEGITCWGRAAYAGRSSMSDQPPVVGPELILAGTFLELASNIEGYCAVEDNGAVWCWGNWFSGVSGSPVELRPAASGAVGLAGQFANEICTIHADNSMRCSGGPGVLIPWGTTSRCTYGSQSSCEADAICRWFVPNTGSPRCERLPNIPHAQPWTVDTLPAGTLSAWSGTGMDDQPTYCAVVDGGVYCWGDNYVSTVGAEGALGLGIPFMGSNRYVYTPTLKAGLASGVTAIAVSDSTRCVVQGGAVRCWYSGSTTLHDLPAPLDAGVVDIAIGGGALLAVLSDGTVRARVGGVTSVVASGLLPGALDASVFGAGSQALCFLDADGRPWCRSDWSLPLAGNSGLFSGVNNLGSGMGSGDWFFPLNLQAPDACGYKAYFSGTACECTLPDEVYDAEAMRCRPSCGDEATWNPNAPNSFSGIPGACVCPELENVVVHAYDAWSQTCWVDCGSGDISYDEMLGCVCADPETEWASGTTSDGMSNCHPICGNGVCQDGEDSDSCPEDCSWCGDGTCDADEDAWSCPDDCGYCGDAYCAPNEDEWSCPDDCGYCGDAYCAPNEDEWSCPDDCGGGDFCDEFHPCWDWGTWSCFC